MNYYKHSRQIYQLVALLFILLLIFFLQPAPVSFSAETLIPPFAPSGYFETDFFPAGNITVGSSTLLFNNSIDLVRSENGGATWRTMSQPYNINTVMPSPDVLNDQMVFAGTEFGIYLSFDRGQTWRSPQQPFNKIVSQITFSPDFATDHTLYAAGLVSPAYLKFSTDKGEHWQDKTLPRNSSVEQLLVSPTAPSSLYIRLSDSSLWYSANGGTTWVPADVGLGIPNGNYVHRLRVAPLGPNEDLLFAATKWGLVLSLDHGQVWYLLSNKHFVELLVLPDVATTQTFFGLEVYNGPFQKTTDLGETWTPQLTGHQIRDIELSPYYQTDQAIFARSSNKLWVSYNRGVNWQQKSGPLAEADFSTIYQVVLSPHYENDGILFAAASLSGGTTSNDQLLRSDDYGQTWSTHELDGEGYIQVAISPNFSNDHTVWATRNIQLHRSTDGGITWSLITSLPFAPFYSHSRIRLSPNYANDHTIFVSHYQRGLYRSTNNGASWVQLVTGMSTAVTDFAISPGYPSDPTLYLSVYNDGLYRSTNGGTVWNLLPQPGFPTSRSVVLSPTFMQDNTLFVAENGNSGGGVYRSTNRGDTWTDITGPDLVSYMRGLAVSPRFAQDQTIVASRDAGHIYISEDAGTTWFQLGELTRIGGINFNWGGLILGYKNGFLQPVAGNEDGIYFYQWPAEVRPPLSIGIPLDPNSTGSGSIPVSMPQSAYELRWAVTENVPWLTVNPAAGPLTTPLVFTVDPTAVTIPASTTVNIGVYYSTNQARFYNVLTRAFYANHHTYMPVMER